MAVLGPWSRHFRVRYSQLSERSWSLLVRTNMLLRHMFRTPPLTPLQLDVQWLLNVRLIRPRARATRQFAWEAMPQLDPESSSSDSDSGSGSSSSTSSSSSSDEEDNPQPPRRAPRTEPGRGRGASRARGRGGRT